MDEYIDPSIRQAYINNGGNGSVVNIRNNIYLSGDRVHIGESRSVFEIKRLGHNGPMTDDKGGVFKNSDEFVQLLVPGSKKDVFNIHSSYLRKVK